ncbi:XRE family transcriptional regulator [Streptomyces sp. NPDC060020]|uniref:XRE family transcriptional regulator n=1 Tax=Streptomyces sp. NPDC060020 TaxID=3347038 RepID=UPI0036BA387B
MAAQDRSPVAGRSQLRDLVRERKAALGLSYDRLAARCVDPESGEQTIKSSWLHRLATNLAVQIPDYAMLRGLAAGLDVPLGRIQDAAGAEFFGMDVVWSASGEARALVEGADKLTPTQREQLQRLIESFTRQE